MDRLKFLFFKNIFGIVGKGKSVRGCERVASYIIVISWLTLKKLLVKIIRVVLEFPLSVNYHIFCVVEKL
jgi:hypothetical protein